MGEMDEGFRLEMAEHIKAEKELKVKLEILEQKLAGPEAKLEKARALLLKAKAACEQFLAKVQPLRSEKVLIEGELALIAEKKSALRQEALFARDGGNRGLRAGTGALVENMNELAGGSLEQSKLEAAGKALDAEAALAALKDKLGKS